MTVWNQYELSFWVIKLYVSLATVTAAEFLLMSRRRHLGLYPRPSDRGFLARLFSVGAMGPRLTFMLQQQMSANSFKRGPDSRLILRGVVLLEWPSGHAAATVTGRNHVIRGRGSRYRDSGVAGDVGTIAAHARVIPVEERGIDRILGISVPVPVLCLFVSVFNLPSKTGGNPYWLVSGVAALFPESILVVPDVVPMPWQEGCLFKLANQFHICALAACFLSSGPLTLP
jgi:hypothetical protein